MLNRIINVINIMGNKKGKDMQVIELIYFSIEEVILD